MAEQKKMNEQEIIKKIKQGHTQYFELLVNKYKRVVYNHAYSFLRNKEDAEDAAQEIFVNTFNNLKGFRGDSSIGTWIYRITVNVCTNKLRQLARQRRQLVDGTVTDDEGEERNIAENVKDSDDKKPDNIFTGEQKKEVIYKRINELPEEQKQVLVLRDIDGLSYEEIADVLKTSVSAVKSKLFRARDNLRQRLKKDDILGL